jgi:hypothetical protein
MPFVRKKAAKETLATKAACEIAAKIGGKHPVTPDGRYFVVRGRLWRLANPNLGQRERARLTRLLMSARRAVRDAKARRDVQAEAAARRAVDEAKKALGERGPVWWTDGAPDLNRHLAKNTPYAAWYTGMMSSPS